METFEAITTRRSIPKVTDERPSREDIERLLEAAVRAPTHHLTEPWRFVVLAGDARNELGEAWHRAEVRIDGKPDGVKEKPLRAPVIITMIGRPRSHLPKVIDTEEHHAIGAAMQNLLLAAHDRGLGAMIRTGKAAELDEVRDYLGCSDEEYVAGFIYVGYPDPESADRPMTRRTPATEITEWKGWDGSPNED